MTVTAIGDLARHLMLQHARSTNKTQVDRLAEELASGKHADPARTMRGDLGPLAAVESGLARIDGWQLAARRTESRLSVMQNATDNMTTIARNQTDALLLTRGNMQPSAVTQAGDDAMAQLDAVLGLLNTQAMGEAVFAGVGHDRPAIGTATELLALLTPIASGQPTAAAAAQAVRDWFDDPGGFTIQFYQGGEPAPAIAISADTAFHSDITAIDPAYRSLLAGLSVAALAGRDLPAGGVIARQMIDHAGDALLSTMDRLVSLGSTIGRHQARAAQAMARNTAEAATMEMARIDLLAADPFKTATALEQATMNLELIHLVTARLQHLSLAEVMR